ncbi:eCIS core domain-containing protein [Dyadobacter arcticus]|uniref:eCIS core domain-containing protein n=1 Tax=Dyadobacter arcticus TaxID=1078754 RepID=A0ABX0UNY7_9BACT|nr:DUF4157 domain-containing protein [Dyadobacter arcticus]NIJ54694.1 hypothetical protein [Dyadobacter arcticus]
MSEKTTAAKPNGAEPAALHSGEVSRAFIIQPKLTMGSPNDHFEQQADQVADRVISMSATHTHTSAGADVVVQRKCAACANEEEQVQRKPLDITPIIQKSVADGGGFASDAVSGQIDSARGGGSPMNEGTRSFMESRFGNNFSGVRIHTDSNAIQLSQNLNAQAFTVGNDVFFNQGKYNPDSDSGKHLLAHELTHTVQQGGGKIKRKLIATGSSGDFVSIVNQILGVQFRIAASATGEISIAATDIQGPPTRDATELLSTLRTIISDRRTVTVDFMRGRTSRRAGDQHVIVGNYDLARVDLDDVDMFGNTSSHSQMGDNSAVQLIHELTEQYRRQIFGEAFPVAHRAGYAAQERLLGATLVSETPMTPVRGSTLREVTTTYRYPSGRLVNITTIMDFATGNIVEVRRAVR